jgi:nitrogen fixation protein NifU and related proteins
MSELSDLYQEVILDHNKNPRNYHKLEGANRHAEGYNPLCGDHLKVFLRLDGDVIQDISFEGSGCAISKASGSMMTASLKGKTKDEAETLFQKFHQMVTGQPHAAVPPELGKLAVFSGVCEFPSRVKCASLAWHTLRSALEGKEEVVSTEKEEISDGR